MTESHAGTGPGPLDNFQPNARALRESEERLRIGLSASGMGLWELDLQTRALYWSPECYEIAGINAFESRVETFEALVHPDDLEDLLRRIDEAVDARSPFDAEFRLVAADGEVRWIRNRGQARYGPRGAPLSLVGTVQDVTASRRAAEQMLETQRLESLGQLAGGIAHDFNNLLTVISVYSGCLEQVLPPGSEALELVGEIRAAGALAASLTRQLLQFSRREVVEARAVDPNAVVAETEKMLGRLLGQDIHVRTSLNARQGVRIDPGQLVQVLLNLALNARDAMPAGGNLALATADVEVTEADNQDVAPGTYVSVVVSDSGSGMPPAIQDRVFEPFFTTKAHSGTGLGLAVVHAIVQQSRAHLRLRSSPGAGTTFTILFPAVAKPPAALDPPRRETAANGEHIPAPQTERGLSNASTHEPSRRALDVPEAAGGGACRPS